MAIETGFMDGDGIFGEYEVVHDLILDFAGQVQQSKRRSRRWRSMNARRTATSHIVSAGNLGPCNRAYGGCPKADAVYALGVGS